ncbi:hypothetical protein ACHAXR_005762 [Thalassiosira sp. AJA248-18]
MASAESAATVAPLSLTTVQRRYPRLFLQYNHLSDREQQCQRDIGDGEEALPTDVATGLCTTIMMCDFTEPLPENYKGCPMTAASNANTFMQFLFKMLNASESGSLGGDACRQFDILNGALDDCLAMTTVGDKFEALLGWTGACGHHGLDALLGRGDPDRNRSLFKAAGDEWKKIFEKTDNATDGNGVVSEEYRKFAITICESFGKLLKMARKEYGEYAKYTFNFIKKPRAPRQEVPRKVVSVSAPSSKNTTGSQPAAASMPTNPGQVTVVVTKPNKDATLGLGLFQEKGANTIKIISIALGSIFDGTQLKVGMILNTINGMKYDSFKHGFDMLRTAEGMVTIVASDPNVTAPTVAAVAPTASAAVASTAGASLSTVAATSARVGTNQKENSAPANKNSTYESDDELKPWEHDGWVPTTKGGKQKTPNVIRGELQRYIDHMGVNNNTFRRFMNPKTYKNPWSAVDNGTYWAAARLLEEVKYENAKAKKSGGAKRKTASSSSEEGSSKKAKGLSNNKMSKAEVSEFLDRINAVNIPTDRGNTVSIPIYDSCPQLVTKIKAFIQRDGMTKAALCKALGDINNNSMGRFLSGKGQDQYANVTYKAGYVFFEKLRILEGQKKSAARMKNEKEQMSGFSVCKARAGKWKYLPGF